MLRRWSGGLRRRRGWRGPGPGSEGATEGAVSVERLKGRPLLREVRLMLSEKSKSVEGSDRDMWFE